MKKPKIDYRFFWTLFCVEVVILLALIAPFLIGRYCGHALGFLMASINILAYVWIGIRIQKRDPVALSTRVIWLLLLFCMICIAGYEWSQMLD